MATTPRWRPPAPPAGPAPPRGCPRSCGTGGRPCPACSSGCPSRSTASGSGGSSATSSSCSRTPAAAARRVRDTALKVLRYDPATGRASLASAWGPHRRSVPEPPRPARRGRPDGARPLRARAAPAAPGRGVRRVRRLGAPPALVRPADAEPGRPSWQVPEAERRALVARFPFVGFRPRSDRGPATPHGRVSAASGDRCRSERAGAAAPGAHASHPPATYQLIEGVQPGSGGRTQPRMSGLLTVCVRAGGAVGAVQPSAGRMVGEAGRPLARLLGRETTETTAAEQRAGATCQGESFATGARRPVRRRRP